MNNAIYINLTGIPGKEALHAILKEALELPDYYGANLDALKDMLTSLDTPKHLEIFGIDDVDPAIKTYVPKLQRVLEESHEENSLFTFKVSANPAPPDRRPLVVCGSWEDAENLNMFLANLNFPELTSRYVVCCFTFGTAAMTGFSKSQIEFKLADTIKKLEPVGMIIFAEMLKSPYLTEYLADIGHNSNIPVFMLEHDEEGCINFKLDYLDGFRKLVTHVVEDHHCTDLMMMAGFKGNLFSEDRIRVFKDVLTSHDIPFDSNKVIYGDFWYIPAKQALQEYFDENGYVLPEAIICANDTMAMGTCDYLIEKGYRIPDDCIVTGFDGIKDSLFHYPTITTAAPDYSQAAHNIISAIDEWYETGTVETWTHKIGYKPLYKHSCGCNLTTMEEMQNISSALFKDNQDYFMHVHEMGRLTSKAITIADTKLLSAFLDKHLWLWKDQMFFVGITESDKCINALYSSWKDIYEYGNKIYNSEYLLPYQNEMFASGSGLNYLIFSQLRSADESYGYLCTGAKSISLRLQQRFEEMESYISSIVHAVLNNKKLMNVNREMKQLSELDYLTGLYNRRGFLSHVAKMVKDPKYKGKIFNYVTMDLDNLKPINDNYGHQEGDTVIKALAYAIQTRVHKIGISSRFGGDEFAFVIISDKALDGESDTLRNELEASAEYDSNLTGKPYRVLASIGVSSCPISEFPSGKIDSTLEKLMNRADEMMYSDKEKRHKDQSGD
ncbi:MAG: diguanylate cyclase [Clostridiales bacterium]|nr:diguanylate cyclase [Clostridiales bacterium]